MFLALYLPAFLLATSKALLFPILPLFVAEYTNNYTLIGVVLAAESLGTLLSDIPAGNLLRRLGHKKMMVLGVLISGLSVVALVWAQQVLLILLLRLVGGVGEALWNTSRHAFLTEATRKTNRGRAIALFGGVARMGAFIGPLIGGTLALRYGFSSVFWLYGLLGAVAMLLCVLFIPRSSTHQAAPSHRPVLRVIDDYKEILIFAGSAQLMAQMIRIARRVLLPLYGSDILGLDVQSIGLIMSLSSGIDMALFYPAGLIMDKLGRKFAIVPAFILQGIGMALIPLSGGFWGLLAAAALIAFGNGLSSGSMMTLGSDLAPEEHLGEFLGVWRLIGDVGMAGAPVAVGVIATGLGLPLTALVMASLGGGASFIFARFVPETNVTARAAQFKKYLP